MPIYPYAVWFRDSSLLPSEQDYEWVACILIEAETAEKAKSWGDHLAKSFAERTTNEQFLRSYVEEPGAWGERDISGTPTIAYGYHASDDEIGW